MNSLLKQRELHIKEHSGPSFAPPPILSIVWILLAACDLLCYHFTMSSSNLVIKSSFHLQCAQFFIQAHFCENTGKIRVLFWQEYSCYTGKIKLMLSSFCDLVHVQSVIDLFAKQLNNALNLHFITKIRAKSQKYGRFSTNARIYGRARIYTGNLGMLGKPGS